MGWQPETQPKGKPPVEKTKMIVGDEGKMSETFRVGDEVQYILEDGRIVDPRFVITSFSHNGSLNGIGKDGIAFCDKNPARWHKTGRHFVEAEKLMKALEDDHELLNQQTGGD